MLTDLRFVRDIKLFKGGLRRISLHFCLVFVSKLLDREHNTKTGSEEEEESLCSFMINTLLPLHR